MGNEEGNLNAEAAKNAEIQDELNRLTKNIIAAAIAVHKELGPGLLESAYRSCLEFELKDRGFTVEHEKELPVNYRGHKLDCGYKIDLVVEQKVLIELKAIETIAPVHEAQLVSYLRLSGCRVGLLINFHEKRLIDGVHRKVNNF